MESRLITHSRMRHFASLPVSCAGGLDGVCVSDSTLQER